MKKKILIKHALKAAGVLFLACAVLILIILHLLTGIVKSQAEKRLSALTDGLVKIDKLDLSIWGNAKAEGITFSDKQNQQRLQIGKVKVSLENWPSLSPAINTVELDDIDLRLSSAKIESFFGVESSSASSSSGRSFPQNVPRNLVVRNLSITLEDYGMQNVYDNISITAINSETGVYDFSIVRPGKRDFEKFKLLGKFTTPDMSFDAHLELQHQFTKEQLELPLEYFDINDVACEGKVAADIKISGLLDDVNSIKPDGIVQLRDFDVLVEGVEKNTINTEMKFDSSGFVLDNLHVLDSNEVEWLAAKKTDLLFSDWPGLEPVLKAVSVDGLNLLVRADSNGISLPIEVSSQGTGDAGNDLFKLEKLEVRNASVGFINKPDSKLDFYSLLIQPTQTEELYEVFFSINQSGESEPNTFLMHGVVNPDTTQMNLSFAVSYSVRKGESAIVSALLGYPDFAARGRVDANMVINGFANELCNMHPSGQIQLNRFELLQNDRIFAREIDASAGLTARAVDFENISAVVCDGPLIGKLQVESLQDNSAVLTGKVGFENVNFHKFLSFFGVTETKNKDGAVTGECTFQSYNCDWHSFESEGQLAFINVDATVFPVIPALFSSLGLTKLDPLTLSDIECKFSLSGPVATLQEAHMANTFGALEFEPGGKINLQTHALDLYVIAVPLRQVDKMVRDLPLADIIFNLRDKLARFYVKGDWSSPPAEIISKTPVKDIQEGTVGFIDDVIKNGGRFGKEMLKGFNAIMSIGKTAEGSEKK